MYALSAFLFALSPDSLRHLPIRRDFPQKRRIPQTAAAQHRVPVPAGSGFPFIQRPPSPHSADRTEISAEPAWGVSWPTRARPGDVPCRRDVYKRQPFFTYDATTYLNESMQQIYRLTPHSRHIPSTLPEDLDPGDITTPGRADDEGIDMPGNAAGVKTWLKRIGMLP